MIRNHLISSLRFLKKHKSFTFINILGLTLGFSSFLLILFYVNRAFSYDQFLKNKENVYRINFSFKDNAGNTTTLVNSPPALTPGIRDNFTGLEKVSRLRYATNCIFAKDDIRFYEDKGYYADSLFLEILQYQLLFGDHDIALDQPNSIVITESLALKYFDTPNPIGETLLLNHTTPLKITGVLADIPSNSHLNFDYLISFSTYTVPEGYASDLSSWSWLGFLTYVELQPNTDSKQFEAALAQYFQALNPEDEHPLVPIVQNISDIYLGSAGMTDDLASHIRSGSLFNVKSLMLIALLILLTAGFNFSNLYHALSINRYKTIGIRKVLGADRRKIATQLLTESLTMSSFCLLLSFGIVLLCFPFVAQFMKWDFTIGLSEVSQALPYLVLVGIGVGVLSGLHPALNLSRSSIINSLKGVFKLETNKPLQLKNVLLLLQFAVSIGLISATFIITKQIYFLKNADTGYRSENVVSIKLLPEDMARYYDIFKEQMSQNASVMHICQSERVLGDPWPFSVILKYGAAPETSQTIFFNQADYDYFETMDIPLISGRTFSKENTNDPTSAVIINRAAAEYLGLAEAVGQQVHFFEQDGPRTIIGVVENFNYASLHQEIGPAAVILPFIDLEYMHVRFQPGNVNQQISLMEDNWSIVSGGAPLEWQFLDESLETIYWSEEKLSTMIQAFSILAILLACLGLYGMVSFMINNRIKEVGVRKILGAPAHSLYALFTRKYIIQTILATLIALPFIHFFLSTWLDNFAYHISIKWWVYPLATIMLIMMILIAVSTQIVKAIKVNPARLLKQE